MGKARSWEIFTARKDKNDSTYFVFNEDVEIFAGGRKISLKNTFIGSDGNEITIKKLQGNNEDKMKERESALMEKEFLSQDQVDKRRAYRNKARVVNTVIGQFADNE